MNLNGNGNFIPRFTLFLMQMLFDQLVRLMSWNSMRWVSACSLYSTLVPGCSLAQINLNKQNRLLYVGQSGNQEGLVYFFLCLLPFRPEKTLINSLLRSICSIKCLCNLRLNPMGSIYYHIELFASIQWAYSTERSILYFYPCFCLALDKLLSYSL